MNLAYNLFSSQWVFFFHVKITPVPVQVCASGALLSGKPNKRNENQKFLAIPGSYLSFSQVVPTPISVQAQRDSQTASSAFLPACKRYMVGPLSPVVHPVTTGRHSGARGSRRQRLGGCSGLGLDGR